MKKLTFLLCLIFLTGSGYAVAGSVAGTGGSTEVTQYLNYGELYSQTDQLITSVNTQMQQLENMRKQVMSLGIIRDFTAARKLFNDVNSTVQQVKSLGYNSQVMASRFSQLYPDFNAKTGTDFFKQYTDWSRDVNSSLKGALQVANLQAGNFANDAAASDTIRKMVSSANTSESQIAAISAGNNVALAMHDELQQMRQMQVVQNAAQTSYLAAQNQQEDKKVGDSKYLENTISNVPACTKTTTGCTQQDWATWHKTHP